MTPDATIALAVFIGAPSIMIDTYALICDGDAKGQRIWFPIWVLLCNSVVSWQMFAVDIPLSGSAVLFCGLLHGINAVIIAWYQYGRKRFVSTTA